mgnify:CR=1 FL=1
MKEIREKRGLAYGVSTQLVPYRHAGLIVGSVATENGRVGESIALVREEWQRMREDGPTAAEIAADAKTYLTGAVPARPRLDATTSPAVLVQMQTGQARHRLSRPPRRADRRRHADRGPRRRETDVRSGGPQLRVVGDPADVSRPARPASSSAAIS